MKNKSMLVFIICLSFIIAPMDLSFLLADKTEAEEEERISLNLKNIEVIELLRILSLKTGKTIVPGREVGGRITVFLNNITLKDVLDIILLTQDYALEKKGNIYYILSSNEYKARNGRDYIEKRKLKTLRLNYAKPANVFNVLSQLKSELGKIIVDEATGTIIMMDIPEKIELMQKTAQGLDQPLQTAIYDLNYAKPADAKTQIGAAITLGTGQVIVDERSAKAIVSDLPAKMEKITRLVKEIDEETRQVFLETEIAEITLSNDFQRGINWEKVFSTSHMAGLDLVGYYPMALTTYQKLTVGTVAANKFNVVLNFLATYGETKIISQPRISVVNNEEASIMVGTREAYVTQTLSQAQSTTVTSEAIEFVDVGVKLKIVPTINKEGFINMKIKPEVSSVQETITTSLGSRIPIVQTSQAETVVKVKDGTMIMIAGMIKEENTDTITGFPWLTKIPVLGLLFSNRNKTAQRTELIIFITPHLIRGDSTLPGYEADKIIPKDIYPENIKRKIIRESEMVSSLEMPGKKMQDAFIKAESRKIDEIKQAEQLKKEEEAKRLEAVKKADEARKQEEARKAEEERKAAEARRQEELNKEKGLIKQSKEAERILEEARKEEARKQDGVKKAEAERIAKAKHEEEVQRREAQRKEAQRKEVELEKAKVAQIPKPAAIKTADRIKAAGYYQKALEAQKASNLQEAEGYLQKSINADANFAIAYNELGIVLEKAGLSEEAEKMYLKTLELDPKCKAAYSNLALLSEVREDNYKAIGYWHKRAQLGGPGDPWSQEAMRHIKELEKKINDQE